MDEKERALQILEDLTKQVGGEISYEPMRIVEEANRLFREFEELEKSGLSFDLNSFKMGRVFGKVEVLTSVYFTLFTGRLDTIADIREIVIDASEKAGRTAEEDARPVNNQLAVAQQLIKNLRKKIQKIRLEKGQPDSSQLIEVAEATRKNNGKLNYSEIGRQLGVSYHTAQGWCRKAKIKHLPQE
jgi:hypothetical protein